MDCLMDKNSCGLQAHYSLQFSKMAIEGKENEWSMREVWWHLWPGLWFGGINKKEKKKDKFHVLFAVLLFYKE